MSAARPHARTMPHVSTTSMGITVHVLRSMKDNTVTRRSSKKPPFKVCILTSFYTLKMFLFVMYILSLMFVIQLFFTYMNREVSD